MKKIIFILFAISSLSLGFTSCGSDDDPEPVKTTYYFDGICSQTIAIKAYANSETVSPDVTPVSLDEMLKNAVGYGTPITGGVLNITDKTSIKVTGLKSGTVLNNFTLNINGIERNFGTIDATTTNLYTSEASSYFVDAFNKMVADKKLYAKIKYTPNSDIEQASNVKLEIIFNGKFSYQK